jgi:outer membrane receptor protein involved in Fe transport
MIADRSSNARRPARRAMRRLLGGSAFVAIISISASAVALAETPSGTANAEAAAPSAAPSDKGQTVAEVVVTAEKRTSTVQNTPMSITAITGDQLKAEGIDSVMGVVDSTPGLSVRTAGPGQTELEMRGLSSGGGSSPTVGFYLDETPLSPPANSLNGKVVIDPDLFDLNRVEVLRGPQGTLYGSGSMGGTVKLVSNQPNPTKYEGEVSAEVSDTEQGGVNGGVNAMINIPLVEDKAALRLVYSNKDVSGWIDRDVIDNFPLETGTCPGWFGYGCVRGYIPGATVNQVNKNVNTEELNSARISLLLKPVDHLTITVSGMDQYLSMGGYSEYDIPYGGGAKLTHYEAAPIAEPFYDTFSLGSVSIKYEAPWFDVTSATSYWSRRESNTMEVTETIQNLTDSSTFIPISFNETDGTKQLSEEFRLSSRGDGRLQWVGGVFYSQLDTSYVATNAAPGYAPISVGGAAANPEGIIYDANNPYHLQQYAVFGDATYQLTSTLRLRAGFRWFHYDTDFSYYETGWGTENGNATPVDGTLTASAQGVNPSFNLSYRPNPDLTIYGTISKGFRPGGVSLPAPASLCGAQPLTYGPDTVTDYEVGEKARLFGGMVTVNSDVYYIKWNNVQQYINPPCDYPYTVNAGTAASYGPEIEVTAKLGHGFTFTANGATTSATLTSVVPSLQTILTVGQRILNIPRGTAFSALSYRTAVTPDLDLVARVQGDYVGDSIDVAYAKQEIPAYALMTARIGLETDKWSVTLFGNNLTNTRAILTINNTSFGWLDPAVTRASTNQPRTIGVNVDRKF